jgi:hypothetical protein
MNASDEEFLYGDDFSSDMDNMSDLDDKAIAYRHKMNILKKLRFYKPDDFLRFPETRKLLVTEWEYDFERNLTPKIEDIFEKHYMYLRNQYSNLLYLASPFHITDLVMLIKHHLKRNYKYELLKDNIDITRKFIDYNEKQKNKKK